MKNNVYAFACLIVLSLSVKAQTSYFDKYLTDSAVLTTVGTSADGINQPRDLDFKPNSNDLWICNYGDANGGSMVIMYNAGLSNQSSQYRKDSHTGHFKIYPSAIAFGDNGFWANTNEIKSTASASSTFMGPALWTADTAIFARVFQNNWVTGMPLGSHYDMLHQSPFAMGIAHDTAYTYWVNDGHNGNICKYDFVKHHGPGYDNHSAGKIWRYIYVNVGRVTNVPSHMVLDKATGWLYYVDGVSKTIRRMNTKTGTVAGTLTPPASGSESLSGYWNVVGSTVEILDTFTSQPCGIEFYKNRLIVSDNTNGNIYIYTVDTAVTLAKTIATGQAGMMGVKVGPDGRIWCVNRTQNKLFRLDIAAPAKDVAVVGITSPAVQNFMPDFFSTKYTLCDGAIAPVATILNRGTETITSVKLAYIIDKGVPVEGTWTGTLLPGATTSFTMPGTTVLAGGHLLKIMVLEVNGVTDEVELNNSIDGSFRVAGSATVPLVENFSSLTFPPAGWNYISYNPNNKMTRATVSAFGTGAGSLKMDNFSGNENISGQVDYFMSPALNLTAATANTMLRFNVAHAQYDASGNDMLEVIISTDCGATWTTAYTKSGSALATAQNSTVSWTPGSNDWRYEGLSLASYAGMPKVLIMFATTSNFSNHLYIDNIVVDNSASVNEFENKLTALVYPNPSTGVATIELSGTRGKGEFKGSVFSFDGKLVKSFSIPRTDNSCKLDLSELPAGIYAVSLSDGNSMLNKTIIKQ